MKIIVSANVKYKGKRYAIGDVININKKDLKQFEDADALAEILDNKDVDKTEENELGE